MKTITAFAADGSARQYLVPSRQEALAHWSATQGEQYDHVEKRKIEGGLPMVWQRRD